MSDQNQLKQGLELLKAGKIDEAIGQLELACEMDPSDYRAFNYLGIAYAQKKLFNRAIGAFNKAIQLRPDIPSVHYNLGLAYDADGLPEKAREEFEKALELDPNYEKAREALKHVMKEEEELNQGQACARHTDEPAIGHCSFCHLPVCKECKTIIDGKIFCKFCAEKLR